MYKLMQYLAQKKLLVFLLVVLMVILGISSMTSLNRESYPEVNFDMVTIMTVYPGGSPDEIEQLISIPIEKEIREVSGIDKVRSYNIENVSVMAIYLQEGNPNKDDVVQKIKDAVDTVEDLPDGAEKPLVEELTTDKTEVISFAVQGKTDDVDYSKLRETGKALEEFLYSFEGVAEVSDEGFLDKEFLVEVNPKALIEHHLAINSIINTLAYRNMDIPGGPLRLENDELILRTKGQYENVDEIKNTAVIANEDYGTKIADLAEVTDTFEEPDVFYRLNGKNSIVYTVLKQKQMDEVKLAQMIRKDFENFYNPYASEVDVTIYNDQSEFTNHTINTVLTNALTGFVLLAIILLIFLGPRMSAIVTMTVPLVFMVAFIGMNMAGITLNVISLFGMVMVLGMIVDFGIVVSENTHRYSEMGLNKLDAVSKGIAELALPVTVTFICISAAFVPLLILTGMMGKFMKYIPMVIIISLTASWLVALFFMPTILNTFMPGCKKKGEECGEELEDGEHLEKGFYGHLQKGYMSLLTFALKFRYVTVGVIFAILVGAVMLIPVVGFVFFSGGGSEEIEIKTTLPVSRNLEYNLSQIKEIEKILMQIPETELENVYAVVGEEVTGFLDPRPGEGTNKATINIYLTPEKDRKRKASEINDEIRINLDAAKEKGLISEDMVIKAEVQEMGPPVGKPINIEIRGKDYDTIREIANEYEAYLGTIDGVFDISDDLEDGKQELRYKINDQMAARTGVSVAGIGNVLNASYSGADATNVKIGDEDIDVRVMFKNELRKTKDSIEDVMISNNSGGLIPLENVTYFIKQPGLSSINRLNYKRLVQVQANVDTEKTTPMVVNQTLASEFADISKKYPGYEIAYGGEQEDTNKSMSQLGSLFVIALLVIYIVLAIFFDSTLVPLVIMSAIPFAMVGIVFALITHGEPMTFMSMLALFSLAGIIVSNTITLIEFVNQKRKEKLPIKHALIEAGALRLRPVILTTGTTVLGLLPSIYGLGDKNYMVAPLALSFGYGLIFATIITLVLVPCFYHIAEDFKKTMSFLLGLVGIKMKSSLF